VHAGALGILAAMQFRLEHPRPIASALQERTWSRPIALQIAFTAAWNRARIRLPLAVALTGKRGRALPLAAACRAPGRPGRVWARLQGEGAVGTDAVLPIVGLDQVRPGSIGQRPKGTLPIRVAVHPADRRALAEQARAASAALPRSTP
jgi:hypothetical protein